MKKIQDLDWFEHSIIKLELALEEIETLEMKRDFNIKDQVKINTILGYLRSPIDYAITEIHRRGKPKRKKAFFPFYTDDLDDKKFKGKIKRDLGTENDDIVNLLKSIQKVNDVNWFYELNEMNNNEKHTSITTHRKRMTDQIGHLRLPGGSSISNLSVVYEEGNFPFVMEGGGRIDPTQAEGFNRQEELMFEFNGKEVFEFLKSTLIEVNEFIIDTYVILEGKEPEFKIK